MITTHVAWSYPTSSNAREFGFDDTGCWTVQTFATPASPPVALAAYGPDLRLNAVKLAASLGHPWRWPESETIQP